MCMLIVAQRIEMVKMAKRIKQNQNAPELRQQTE